MSGLGRGTESFPFCLLTCAPQIVSTMWSYRGVKEPEGSWDFRMKVPSTVLGHILFLVNDKRIYKNALKMTYGWCVMGAKGCSRGEAV